MMNSNLPNDLVMDILARLPVKSLMRLRCVCKSWYVLIRNINFVTQHLNHPSSSFVKNEDDNTIIIFKGRKSNTDVSLLSSKNLQFLEDVAMPFFEGSVTGLYMYGPCDGIVCLYGSYIIGLEDNNNAGLPRSRVHGDHIALWNPATREFKALPPSCVPLPPGQHISSAEFGIGFDVQTNDYKVVRISNLWNYNYPYLTDDYQVELYTLSTNSWRKVETIVPATIDFAGVVTAYLNGFYYWWAKDENVYVLLSFDMSNEVFQKVLLPPDVGQHHEAALMECNGSIFLSRIDWWDGSLTIWVMNEDGVATNKWIKQVTIEHSVRARRLLGFFKNGDLLMEEPTRIGYELVSYCPSTREFGHHRIHGTNSIQVVICKETLVSLSSKKENELSHEDTINSSDELLDRVHHTKPGPTWYELLELNLSLNSIYSLDD